MTMFRTPAAACVAATLAACATPGTPPTITPTKAGLVEYHGSQKTIFDTGKAEKVVPVGAMSGAGDLHGVGAVAGLDGEITVLRGKPFVTKVRGPGDAYTMDNGTGHHATFAVWARVSAWTEQPVPAEIKSYLDLQSFVKARAAAAGIDASKPFPFQLAGAPAEVKWHINVDLTGGKPIDTALFVKSKANYVARNEPMEIVGFFSEQHGGVFTSAYVPAIPANSGIRNALHIHMVTRDGKAAGHIDNLTLAPGMVLRLPKI
ncbi:MAG TPA: acetolactate decarboxylase [Rubrivivax sp.]|nr:acetolactate decarboxylase [Rubrivivax sp.]